MGFKTNETLQKIIPVNLKTATEIIQNTAPREKGQKRNEQTSGIITGGLTDI